MTLVLCVGAAVILCLGPSCGTPAPSGENHRNMVESFQQRRRAYLDNFADRDALFDECRNQRYRIRLVNPSDEHVVVSEPRLFLTMADIKESIGARGRSPDEARALRIFDFVRDHSAARFPLYSRAELHDPLRFFSVYGCGFCDDMATNLAMLAIQYGFNARQYGLNGHVVAELEYESGWHIFDPYTLGIVRVESRIADYGEMVDLARAGRLASLNESWGTEHDNTMYDEHRVMDIHGPFLEFLAHEQRLFFERPFVLATGGAHLPEFKNRETFLDHYTGLVANSVRVIDLDAGRLDPQTGDLTLRDYFPFVGVYLRVEYDGHSLPENLPKMRTATNLMHVSAEGMVVRVPGRPSGMLAFHFDPLVVPDVEPGAWILDFSSGLLHVSHTPSREIVISNLRPLLAACEAVELLTVHPYSLGNSDFGSDALAELEEAGIEVDA